MALELQDLGKTYGDRVALQSVDLRVEPGEACLLVGPNGSGKSTLLGLVAGLRVPTSGSARIDGLPTRDPAARVSLGVLFERARLPPHHSLVRLLGALGRDPGSLLSALGLAEHRDRPLGTLSSGLHQRAALCLALAGSPRWIVLDEPLTALDGPTSEVVVGIVAERVRAGAGALIATHRHDAWAPVSTGVAVLEGGRLSMGARP
ncbi:MAG: ABC transporter ATP-binding protein [Myxococcota bacterium]